MRPLWKASLLLATSLTLLANLLPAAFAQTCTVTISPSSVTVASGGTQHFTGSITPSSCSHAVVWAATAGTVPGGSFTAPLVTSTTSVTVTVTQTASPFSQGSASVTVTPPTLNSITVTPASVTIPIYNTEQFTATGNYSDGTHQNLTSPATWSASTGGYVTLGSAGLATGASVGSATVTATVGSLTSNASATVAVNSALSTSFFAMDVNANSSTDPWPGVSPATGATFGTYRSLGSSIKWADVYDCANSAYFFNEDPTNSGGHNTLYKWMTLAQSGGEKVMFTAYYTPNCLLPTAYQTDTVCAFSAQPGGCDLPGDVFSGDTTWISFITNLTSYLNSYFPGQLAYIEVWNEPNIPGECNAANNCTLAALAQMTKDAYTTVAGTGIKIISPPVTGVQTTADCIASPAQIVGYLNNYLSQTVSGVSVTNYFDIVGFHGYVELPAPNAETASPDPASGGVCIASLISSVQSVAHRYTTKPIYDTEGSWGVNSRGNPSYTPETWLTTLPYQEPAFTAISYLIRSSNSVCLPGGCNNMAGFSWYGWDFGNSGAMWNTTAVAFTPAGTAYTNVYQWMSDGLDNVSPIQPCSASGSVWTCNLSRPSGYFAQAVWDTSQSCLTGTCTTSAYTIPAAPDGTAYIEYRDLAGGLYALSGATTVQIGLQPILIDNNSAY